MNRLFALAAAAVALLLVTGGCGVGSTDSGAVADATGDYLTALADGDYLAACNELAPSEARGRLSGRSRGERRGHSAGQISDDNDGKISIELDGDAATVTLESGTTLELTSVAGAWLVSSPYGG